MARKKKSTGFNSGAKTNICFQCQKACGGCSWSGINPETGKPRFEPVPGWTATPVVLRVSDRFEETYQITACPEFVPDVARPVYSSCEITDEDFVLLMKRWGIWGYFDDDE